MHTRIPGLGIEALTGLSHDGLQFDARFSICSTVVEELMLQHLGTEDVLKAVGPSSRTLSLLLVFVKAERKGNVP